MEKFEDSTHYKEILLRGHYLTMAVDIDWILLMIIAKCFVGNEQQIFEIYDKEVHELTLFEKIGTAQIGLLRYHPTFFHQHKEDFKLLNELRGVRNKLGHGKIDWEENSKENLIISEAKQTGIETSSYKFSELFQSTIAYKDSLMNFLKVIQSFINLEN